MGIFARLTVAEYGRMLIAGVFDQGRRVEFIEGEIREMAPIGPEHETVVDQLTRWSFRSDRILGRRLPESSCHCASRSRQVGLPFCSDVRRR